MSYIQNPQRNNQVENLQIEHAILKNNTMQSVARRSPFQEKKTTDPSEGLRCDKVDEGVAHIGTILRIHWQVEKVIAAFESRVVNLLQEASLRVPVWNVAEHHRRLWPNLLTWTNRGQVSFEVA